MDASRNFGGKNEPSAPKMPTHNESDEFVDVSLKSASIGASQPCSPAVQRKFTGSNGSEAGGHDKNAEEKGKNQDCEHGGSEAVTTHAGVCKTCGPYGKQRVSRAGAPKEEPERETIRNVGSSEEPVSSIEVGQSDAPSDQIDSGERNEAGDLVEGSDADKIFGKNDDEEDKVTEKQPVEQDTDDDGANRRKWLKKNASFAQLPDDYEGKMSKDDMEKNVMQWLKLEPLELDTTNIKKKRRVLTFEQAMTRIKFGRFNWYVILIAGLVIMAGFTEACGVSYIMPVSQCDLNLTTHHKGILGAVALLGTICSAYMWGYLADKKGRRYILRPTLIAAVVFSIFSSFVKNFYIFAILRFCVGFFISGGTASIYAYLSEFHGKNDRSRSIMYAAVIFGLLCFLLPFAAYVVINERWHYYIPLIGVNYKPWRFFLVVCTTLEITALIFITLMPESPRYLLANGHKEEVIRILEWMNRVNNGPNARPLNLDDIVDDDDAPNEEKAVDDEHGDQPHGCEWLKRLRQRVPLLQPQYLLPLVLICSLQFVIFYVSNGFYIFFNEILNRMANNLNSFVDDRMDMCENINLHHAKAKEFVVQNGTLIKPQCVDKLELETVLFALIMEAFYPIGFAIISVLINRIPRFHILFFIFSTSGIAALVCHFTDVPLVQAAAFIYFECAGIAGNVVSTSTVELFPTNIRAVAMSITSTMARLGGVVGSNVSGILLDNHCRIAFYIPGIALIGASIVVYFVPKIRVKPEKNQPRFSVISL